MTMKRTMVAVFSLLLPLSLYAKNDPPELDSGYVLAGNDKVEEGTCACESMEIEYVLNIDNKVGNIIAEGDRTQTAKFGTNESEVELDQITASETNVEVGKKLVLTVTPELKCTCSVADSTCEEQPGTVEVEITHGKKKKKETLEKNFSLSAVPFEIDVMVSKSCQGENCAKETCSVTIPIKIELDKDKNKKKK